MKTEPGQLSLFDQIEELESRSALDELFISANAYRNSRAYFELMRFISRFTRYSPYNAFLLHVQNPKATYVATPNRWKKLGRRVKPEARTLILIAPMRPVLFVYDLEDTEGKDLPEDLLDPFDAQGEISQRLWDNTVLHAEGEKIAVCPREMPFLEAGAAIHRRRVTSEEEDKSRPDFIIEVNRELSLPGKYATLVHELGHIYAGHLGKVPDAWWPDRRGLSHAQVELEAESISFLKVAQTIERMGQKAPAASAGQDTIQFDKNQALLQNGVYELIHRNQERGPV